jgi:hypothetical protein
MSNENAEVVLMRAYWFAPHAWDDVHRIVAKYWHGKEQGADVVVVTSSDRKLVKQDVYEFDEKYFLEVLTADYRFFYALLSRYKRL